MRIDVKEMTGKTVLAGAQAGRQLLSDLITRVSDASQPEVLFLDFRHVEAATSSYLRESIFAYRDYARANSRNFYPVVANPSDAVTEELQFYTTQRSDTLIACDLSDEGGFSKPRLLGTLDPAQRQTLDLTLKLGRATAQTLAENSSDSIGLTAWNNRLSALAAKGLLFEERDGKTKVFKPIMEAI
jgi:hypothetical protein